MSARARYDLEERLGDGGAGTVYRARQRSSGGRLVALKRIRVAFGGASALLPRLRHAAEVLAALDHPAIVRVYEVMPDGDGVAIAMQYAPGGSLADRIATSGPLDAGEVLDFAIPVANALSAAHAEGLVHGGIAPGNILFTADGHPLLSDFGLGGDAVPDPASDVYRLGLVCAEALGDAPDAPDALVRVLERATSMRIEDRYETASDFAAALRFAADDDGEPAPDDAPDPEPAPEPPPIRERESTLPSLTTPWPEPTPARGVPRGVLLAAAAGLLAVLIAVVLPRAFDEPAPAPAEPVPSHAEPGTAAGEQHAAEPAPAPAGLACPDSPSPSVPDGQVAFRADTDGDGCTTWLRWDGAQLVVYDTEGQPGQTYRMGSPGDQLVLGDWDCDGSDTPGLYRPSNGQVYLFDGWAGPGQDMPARVGGTLAPNGQAEVVEGADDGSECADRVTLARG